MRRTAQNHRAGRISEGTPQQTAVSSLRMAQLWHAAVSSLRTAQLWEPPALTDLRPPAGASACPYSLFPQHAAVSSLRIPQLCLLPALTDLRPPVGASACPYSLFPQHAAVSSLRTAQLWPPPALTDLRPPVGASACPRSLCSGLFAAPHSAEDLVGYVEPVGSSGFASGLFSLAFGRGGQLLPPAGSRC